MLVFFETLGVKKGSWKYNLYANIFSILQENEKEVNSSIEVIVFLEELKEIRLKVEINLHKALSKKENPPQNVPLWVIDKWHRENPGKEIIILGKNIKIGGEYGIRYSEIDRLIIAYNKLLNIILKCIEENKDFKILKMKNDDFNNSKMNVD